MVDLLVLATVVFTFGLVLRRLQGTILGAPPVFVAANVMLGPAGLVVIEEAPLLAGHAMRWNWW